MCDPTIAVLGAAALATAGTVAKSIGASQSQDAQNAAIGSELQRQKALDDERRALFTKSLNTQTRPAQDQQLAQQTQQLADQGVAGVKTQAPEDVPLAGNAATIVRDTIADRLAKADQGARDEATRRAGLDAWSNLTLGNQIELGRNNGQIGILGDFSRASSNLLPMELQRASQEGSFASNLGDLFGGIGGVVGAGAANPQFSWSSLLPSFGSSAPKVVNSAAPAALPAAGSSWLWG